MGVRTVVRTAASVALAALLVQSTATLPAGASMVVPPLTGHSALALAPGALGTPYGILYNGGYEVGMRLSGGPVAGALRPPHPAIHPVIWATPTPDHRGYWLGGADGGVFALGDANYYGSIPGLDIGSSAPERAHIAGRSAPVDPHTLNAPIVAMASTADGRGYWLAGADGGVFAFGDARFHGSMAGTTLNAPIVSIAATPDGGGYLLTAADGGVFAFGDARFFGSASTAMQVNAISDDGTVIVGSDITNDGGGYWEVGSDGGTFAFGDAQYLGSLPGFGLRPSGSGLPGSLSAPIVGMAATSDDAGYWMLGSDGAVYSFGDATYAGGLNSPSSG